MTDTNRFATTNPFVTSDGKVLTGDDAIKEWGDYIFFKIGK